MCYDLVVKKNHIKYIIPSHSKYNCERCDEIVPAYYTLSLLTKGLYVSCPNCGLHARPYVPNLPLHHRPSKHYLRNKALEVQASIQPKLV